MLGTDFFFEWGESDNIEVDTIILSEWDGGATVSVVVTNNGSEAASDWGLRWESPGDISFFWDADISMDGDVATALPSADRKTIAPGEAVAFGFNLTTGTSGWTEPVFEFGRLTGDGTSPDPAPPIETPDPDPPVDQPGGQPDDDNPQPGSPVATDLLDVSVLKASTWNTGFSANVVVANPTNSDMTLTDIRWAMPQGLSIDSTWNAAIEVTDAIATVTPDDAFLLVKAGQAVSFGFNASHPDGMAADILPTVYVVSDGGTVPPDADGPPPVPTDPVPADPWDGDEPLNPIIGTQTIGPGYTFTDENELVETARAIEAIGSNIIKIALDPTLYGMSSLNQWQPVELLSQNEAFRQVLQMDFDHYFFWLERSGPWVDNQGISQEEHDHEYAVTYALARYLLETFQDTGKTFYIGNWETDWNLLEWNPTVEDVDDMRIQGLIDWLNLRQDAIDQAEIDVDADGVSIFHYVEVNRVDDAQELGFERVVNHVLPHTNVDLVSYSAYDVILKEENIGRYDQALGENLDYIESLLKPKEGLPFEKRVFIGEFGFYLQYVTPEQQYDLTLDVLKASVEWGVPFSLIWQMYDTAANEGLYLVGPDGQPTELHETLTGYNQLLSAWHQEFKTTAGRVPTEDEIREKSLSLLNSFSTTG
ncbi:MAG: cellulose binding domain-containing protein [Alphaproteobacteria bacterium]|nr:cellulose binding domain-containing protein [Alphaproteobacteria bacterium]